MNLTEKTISHISEKQNMAKPSTILHEIIKEIRIYQRRLNPNLNHDDLIRSNTCEEVIDIIKTHLYLDF